MGRGQEVTVKTSLVTEKPAVKSAKVSRQGTKRNVAVTFTVPKSCDGTDWVLAKKVSKLTTWPTRSELTNSAVVVLSASLLIALVVFAMDFVFQSAMEVIYPN